MDSMWIIAGIVVVGIVARPLLRLVLANLFAGAVSSSALAKQPDSIRLVAAGPTAWRDRAAADRAAAAWLAHGFTDAGTWTVNELPGMVVRLLVSPAASLTGAVYEHPKAGSWCELFYRMTDGTSSTFSSSPPTGLNDRPGHRGVRRPGAGAAELLDLALADRPSGSLVPVNAEAAPRRFEEAFADSMAWRKQNGISRAEVVNVAQERAA
jgi:hypothetical protein